jgi:hypothetical protein
MTAQRLPDWPERLAAYVEERRAQPFVWGNNDCASFAAGALRAMTGADPLGELTWTSEAEAQAVLARLGGLAWAARRVLGRPLPGHERAPRGAVVCARINDAPTLGVQLGAWWCAPGGPGLVFRRTFEVRLAWGL